MSLIILMVLILNFLRLSNIEDKLDNELADIKNKLKKLSETKEPKKSIWD